MTYFFRQQQMAKGWGKEIRDAWDEADHPRGKTTPESNSGSFAPRGGEGGSANLGQIANDALAAHLDDDKDYLTPEQRAQGFGVATVGGERPTPAWIQQAQREAAGSAKFRETLARMGALPKPGESGSALPGMTVGDVLEASREQELIDPDKYAESSTHAQIAGMAPFTAEDRAHRAAIEDDFFERDDNPSPAAVRARYKEVFERELAREKLRDAAIAEYGNLDPDDYAQSASAAALRQGFTLDEITPEQHRKGARKQ